MFLQLIILLLKQLKHHLIVTEESTPFEIEVETNTPVNIEETLVNATESKTLDQDIENLFNDIYREAKLIEESSEKISKSLEVW